VCDNPAALAHNVHVTRSLGLTHVAMSVPPGTLTEDYRVRLLAFYGRLLGWREMDSLRLPDRLTISVGGGSYVNLRERAESLANCGYEHFGILVASADTLRRTWDDLAEGEGIELEPLTPNERGEGSFRFRYLLPMAVEVQFYAALSPDPPRKASPALHTKA
jgi:hypothetical protein